MLVRNHLSAPLSPLKPRIVRIKIIPSHTPKNVSLPNNSKPLFQDSKEPHLFLIYDEVPQPRRDVLRNPKRQISRCSASTVTQKILHSTYNPRLPDQVDGERKCCPCPMFVRNECWGSSGAAELPVANRAWNEGVLSMKTSILRITMLLWTRTTVAPRVGGRDFIKRPGLECILVTAYDPITGCLCDFWDQD